MAKLPTIIEMAEKVAKEALEIIYTEKPELKEISEAYQEGHKQGRADAIDEFEPLFNLLVGMESEYICNEMSITEYCEENCNYICPQKECYLHFMEQIKEQKK